MTDNIFPEDIDGGGIRGQGGGVFWMTGLSGSGKSTLAKYIADILGRNRYYVYVLDGDNIRNGLCEDLGFSPEDRKENIRRISYVARMMADAGLIIITAFISPYREDRAEAKRIIGDTFIEAHVSTSLRICEGRDPKGLYVKARSGEIPSFTGISAPYEQPENPDMILPAGAMSIKECASLAIQFMRERWMI